MPDTRTRWPELSDRLSDEDRAFVALAYDQWRRLESARLMFGARHTVTALDALQAVIVTLVAAIDLAARDRSSKADPER